MSDQELLELAAKANGMTGMRYSPSFGMVKMIDPNRPESTGSYGPDWNPLTDDGDALRLAVKLNMTVSAERRVIEVEYYLDGNVLAVEEDGEKRAKDPLVATRRAIVRAAAEIGKTMP